VATSLIISVQINLPMRCKPKLYFMWVSPFSPWTDFIFGVRQNSGATLKTGVANPSISPISPFLKPPLV